MNHGIQSLKASFVFFLFFSSSLGFAQEKPTPFLVGAILPLTGPVADYGQAMVNSIQLAQEDHPELFKNVKFIFEDAQYKAPAAVSAFKKLTEVDKVSLVYTWGITFCQVIAPMAERMQMPTVGQCLDANASRDKKYFIRFMNYTDQFMGLQTEYLNHIGAKKLGILLAENSYLQEVMEALKRTLQPGQTVEILGSYPMNDMDLRDALIKARTKDYDALGVFLGAGQISQFYRLAREQNLQRVTFGTNYFGSLSEINASNGSMEGAFFTNTIVNEEYRTRYKKKFGNDSQLGFGSLSYEFAVTVGKSVTDYYAKNTSTGNIPPILDLLRTMRKSEGQAAGPYEFRDTKEAGGFFEFPLTAMRICDSEFKPIRKELWPNHISFPTDCSRP